MGVVFAFCSGVHGCHTHFFRLLASVRRTTPRRVLWFFQLFWDNRTVPLPFSHLCPRFRTDQVGGYFLHTFYNSVGSRDNRLPPRYLGRTWAPDNTGLFQFRHHQGRLHTYSTYCPWPYQGQTRSTPFFLWSTTQRTLRTSHHPTGSGQTRFWEYYPPRHCGGSWGNT